MTRQSPFGKTVSKGILRYSDYVCVCVDPPKSTKIEAESLKEGIISAVKLTKVFGDSFNNMLIIIVFGLWFYFVFLFFTERVN